MHPIRGIKLPVSHLLTGGTSRTVSIATVDVPLPSAWWADLQAAWLWVPHDEEQGWWEGWGKAVAPPLFSKETSGLGEVVDSSSASLVSSLLFSRYTQLGRSQKINTLCFKHIYLCCLLAMVKFVCHEQSLFCMECYAKTIWVLIFKPARQLHCP